MAETTLRRADSCDTTLLYAAQHKNAFLHKDQLEQTRKYGLKTVYISTLPSVDWTGETGYIDIPLIHKYAVDYTKRTAYISGPPDMVEQCTTMLHQSGISLDWIKQN
jgi:NAD(P)H-flavin reductase